MLREISVSEPRDQFSRLIEWVRTGERFVITVRDPPVAELIPCGTFEVDKVRQAIDGLKSFQETYQWQGLSIRQMIEEGRRH